MPMKLKMTIGLLATLLAGAFSACSGGEGIPQTPAAVPDSASQASSAAMPQEAQGIGNVYFLPYQQQALMGTNTLGMYAQMDGLVPGTGILTLHKEDGTVVDEIHFADRTRVQTSVLSEQEAELVDWDTLGSKATLILAAPLTEVGKYYVTMTDDCLRKPDETAKSRALGQGLWEFSIAPFGITGGTLYQGSIHAGDTRTISVALAEEAVKCRILGADGAEIELVTGELSAAGDLQLKFLAASSYEWDVAFLNAAGECVGLVNLAADVLA